MLRLLVPQQVKVRCRRRSDEAYLGDNGMWSSIRRDIKPDSIAALFAEDQSNSYGDVDILVNNAGITRDNMLNAHERRTNVHDIIQTNLSSVFRLSLKQYYAQ